MFATSSQRSHWTFGSLDDLERHRHEANKSYIATHGKSIPESQWHDYFLTPEEERLICRHFLFVMQEFCKNFSPPLPRNVTSTACMYFKRLYLYNSAMDYVPQDMMLVCVYLACKVEEFFSPIKEFVMNLRKNREKHESTIRGFELLLVTKLGYELMVHTPHRPMEGLLIHIKTKCQDIEDAEVLRPEAENFLRIAEGTDVPLLFAPSQIALAALMGSAEAQGVNLESYVANELMEGLDHSDVELTLQQVARIREMVVPEPPPPRELWQSVLRKLEKCRNPENNPDSKVYKRKMEKWLEEEDALTAGVSKKRKEDDE